LHISTGATMKGLPLPDSQASIGDDDGPGPTVRLGIVVAEFNGDVTRVMLKEALDRAQSLHATVKYVCTVPGAYDMPLIIQDLLEKDDVDAVVTLGAIVKGDTQHDEVIGVALANHVAGLALRYRKPVALGVSGPGMTWEQALARKEEYAKRCVEAAVKLARRHMSLVNLPARTDPDAPVVIE
jgi:6,7-dimethyl-8-ribityllumazine synthase